MMLTLTFASLGLAGAKADDAVPRPAVASAAPLFPLTAVRLLDSPFSRAAEANRQYMLALDPDRLLAPFRREAGLEPRKPSYGNWESGGLDGHTAGHYLSALADMVAAGHDKTGELRRRLDYMVAEMEIVQQANCDGYIGGVPGSRELWKSLAAGQVDAVWKKWVPWYNVHKTFAGLRDAYVAGGNANARALLIRLGDWAAKVTTKLSDAQMQQMLGQEHGGMNEVFADIYALTKDEKYLVLARRFSHNAVLDPLKRQEDRLTGLHANTQIPKVIGLERIAALTGDKDADSGARFFWETVTGRRSVAFGGNSVSEHFNDPKDFRGLLEHREGPETCNTYNMLRLTEQLFTNGAQAAYADYYERALYNHILASINTEHPGFVYFTPIRPGHYRVYSQPDQGFWCCVGTGMENPGRYGQFIYAKATDGYFVNLFIASELSEPGTGFTLRQETAFPDEERTRLSMKLPRPATFTLYLRHPKWLSANTLEVKVNGQAVTVQSTPSSYAAIRRKWRSGDHVEVALPMQTTVEPLPDGSAWNAILHGPIVLASPAGTENLVGLRAGAGRGDHIAHGPLVSLDKMPSLLTTAAELPQHVVPDQAAGPLHFRLKDVAEPAVVNGLPLIPFFRLHDARYQMYWEITSKESLAARKDRLAADEHAKLDRDAATLDSVAVGEQQPEVDHAFTGEGAETGIHEGRRWRHGRSLQYTLDTHGEREVDLAVTYWGGDNGRTFDIFANDTLLATQELKAEKPGQFFENRYAIPAQVLTAAPQGRVTIKFVAKVGLAGGVFDVRLMKRNSSAPPGAAVRAETAQNPIIYADVPDMAMIRVGDTYYMSSTTMHMSPGLPIMKSKDLVNWKLVSYAYDTLGDNDALTLQNGKSAYGAGSWASSLRYHDGTFYVTTFSSTVGKTHIFTTKDIEKGPWKETSFRPSLHDHSLFFDDDGRVYMLYGGGNLRLTELSADLSGIKPGGFDQVVVPNASAVAGPNVGLNAEGSQLLKHDGKYYVFNITWPRGGMRTAIVHRAEKITGPWEGRVALQDKGVAQGSLIDTPQGEWYAYLFQDHGAVGRIPYLVPVKWEDGWPVLGPAGKVPETLNLPANKSLMPGIVASDEFTRRQGEAALPLVWQWNHNPDNNFWSLTQRPGFLRLTTGRVDSNFLAARNSLTQRTFGPECSGTVAIDVSQMKDGDVAGLGALQRKYGFVGVKREGAAKSLIMVSAESNNPQEMQSVPLNQETVFLKIDCDFKERTDKATFFFSLDNQNWTVIGKPLQMAYTLPHFMGYRFALFNYATKNAGGFVDFDYFRLSDKDCLFSNHTVEKMHGEQRPLIDSEMTSKGKANAKDDAP